jgi:multiple sugar transport system ATP-binding protein
MDEPLSNLDAKLRTEMRVEIKKLQKKVAITTLYITHDQAEAMSMADNIAIMEAGKILQLGSPQNVYNKPANQFVGSFIGNPPMNFLKFRIGRGESMFLKLDNGNSHEDHKKSMVEVPAVLSAVIEKTREENIILGIRPRDIMVLGNDEGFDGLRLQGVVTYIELFGDDSIAELKLGQASLKISNVASRVDDLIIGKEVALGIKYDKINLFTSSGQRINL